MEERVDLLLKHSLKPRLGLALAKVIQIVVRGTDVPWCRRVSVERTTPYCFCNFSVRERFDRSIEFNFFNRIVNRFVNRIHIGRVVSHWS
jgi:hypothetical protein